MPFTDKSLRRIALGCAVLSVTMLSKVAAQGIQPADATGVLWQDMLHRVMVSDGPAACFRVCQIDNEMIMDDDEERATYCAALCDCTYSDGDVACG
jgi:hypothetical protein